MEKQKEDKVKLIYAAAAVRKVINEMEPGTLFHGHELKAKCVKLYPQLKNMYVETFLREMRLHCKMHYNLESRRESLYSKI